MDNTLTGNNSQIITRKDDQGAEKNSKNKLGSFIKNATTKLTNSLGTGDHQMNVSSSESSEKTQTQEGKAEENKAQPVKRPPARPAARPQNKGVQGKPEQQTNPKAQQAEGQDTAEKKPVNRNRPSGGQPRTGQNLGNNNRRPAPKTNAVKENKEKTGPVSEGAKSTQALTETKIEPKKFNTKSTTRKHTMSKGNNLSIIPLGGLGEIGKNMTAIKYGNTIIVIDGGMAFPDDDLPGIDLVIPDYNYLLENKKLIKGIFVTHGHEDHIGALPYVLKDLNVPVYGGKLTLGLLKGKLKEHHLNNVKTNEITPRELIPAGPFKVEFIRVSHSIPDSFAIAIHTPIGVILHTGDFKMDMSPVDGELMDIPRLAALGEEGVLLLMADSTNVEMTGSTPSEKSVGNILDNIFYSAKGRIFLTTFASNVHRVQQAIWAAEHTDRKVAVVGRGMNNVIGISSELGYLDVKPNTFIDINQVNSYPDNKVVIITTGSQGESLAGLTRMSQDEHRQIHFRVGDLVIISAHAIPGNEKTISKTVDNLYRHGAEVVYGRGLGIHVSGHANQEDLKLILNLIKPKHFMPIHGEYRMLHNHAKLGEKMGIKPENIYILENGQVLEVNKNTGAITGKVHSGRILIDGLGVGDVGTAVLKDRKQLSNDGIVLINLVMDKEVGRMINDLSILSRGFVYEKENSLIFSEAEQRVLKIVDSLMGKDYNLTTLKTNIKNNLGKYFYDQTGRRPIILPIVMEV